MNPRSAGLFVGLARPANNAVNALGLFDHVRRIAASDFLKLFDPVPQLLRNVRYAKGKQPLDADSVKAAIADGMRALNGTGRLVIRPSGTEPVIRVMAEGDNGDQVTEVVERICAAVAEAASA